MNKEDGNLVRITMEYYLAIKRNAFESVLVRWMTLLEPVLESEVSQKEKNKYHTLMHINLKISK